MEEEEAESETSPRSTKFRLNKAKLLSEKTGLGCYRQPKIYFPDERQPDHNPKAGEKT